MRFAGILMLIACGASAPSSAPEATTAERGEAEAPVAAEAADWSHHGQPFTVTEAVAASAVFADPEAHSEGPVRMRGELSQVCQKAGCWAVVRTEDGSEAMRITMKDHAFGIAKDTVGHACDVEGQLVRKDVDPEALAHYESEGATDHPEAGKAEAWELVATGVATRKIN